MKSPKKTQEIHKIVIQKVSEIKKLLDFLHLRLQIYPYDNPNIICRISLTFPFHLRYAVSDFLPWHSFR